MKRRTSSNVGTAEESQGMLRKVALMTIGFVTSAELGGITPDDGLIASVLLTMGVDVRTILWDGGEPPEDLDALVLRSPWNYHLTPDTFLDWVDRAGESAVVCNDPRIVRWNAHKSYLFELQHAGIPIAETVLCRQHEAADLRAIMDERKWNTVVVKPAISASSFMTSIIGATAPALYSDGRLDGRVFEDGQLLLEAILQTRDAIVQPFMPEIFERGERCLIFIDGEFSHAVRKAPFTDLSGGGQAVVAEPHEITLGRRALSVLSETPLYARIDLLRGTDGVDRLMELELIDPELYMRFDSESPRRFASALLRRF
jgi:glutathione synthase/RimK-type ligase-like ATP-grasp enzyme